MTRKGKGEKILKSIKLHQHPRFDTLYCTKEQMHALSDTISEPHVRTGNLNPDKFKIFGLNIIVMDNIERPIMCEKGDVFPIVSDYD